MAPEWFYTKDGKNKIGPVASADLQALARSGQLFATDMVWKEGMVKWTTASSIKGLFANPDSTPKAPPSPEAIPLHPPPRAATPPPGPVRPASSAPAAEQEVVETVSVNRSSPGRPKGFWRQFSTEAKVGIIGAGAGAGLLLLVVIILVAVIGVADIGQTAGSVDMGQTVRVKQVEITPIGMKRYTDLLGNENLTYTWRIKNISEGAVIGLFPSGKMTDNFGNKKESYVRLNILNTLSPGETVELCVEFFAATKNAKQYTIETYHNVDNTGAKYTLRTIVDASKILPMTDRERLHPGQKDVLTDKR